MYISFRLEMKRENSLFIMGGQKRIFVTGYFQIPLRKLVGSKFSRPLMSDNYLGTCLHFKDDI